MKFNVVGIMLAVVLTARLGVYHNGSTGLTETWYNRSMSRVVSTAQSKGIPCEYWVRDDGVNMFGQWVIIAAHPSVTRYTFVETSLGTGIVLDRHTVNDKTLIDIATAW